MIKWALGGRLLQPVPKSEKIPSQAGTLPAARLLQPNMCLPGVGLENPMVDPFVQLNTKHSSVELSW